MATVLKRIILGISVDVCIFCRIIRAEQGSARLIKVQDRHRRYNMLVLLLHVRDAALTGKQGVCVAGMLFAVDGDEGYSF